MLGVRRRANEGETLWISLGEGEQAGRIRHGPVVEGVGWTWKTLQVWLGSMAVWERMSPLMNGCRLYACACAIIELVKDLALADARLRAAGSAC